MPELALRQPECQLISPRREPDRGPGNAGRPAYPRWGEGSCGRGRGGRRRSARRGHGPAVSRHRARARRRGPHPDRFPAACGGQVRAGRGRDVLHPGRARAGHPADRRGPAGRAARGRRRDQPGRPGLRAGVGRAGRGPRGDPGVRGGRRPADRRDGRRQRRRGRTGRSGDRRVRGRDDRGGGEVRRGLRRSGPAPGGRWPGLRPQVLFAAVGLRGRTGRAGPAHRAQAGAGHRPRAAAAGRRGGVGQRGRRPGRGGVLVRAAGRGSNAGRRCSRAMPS